MNSLTKFLVESILGDKEVIVVYGGGFKPPHKGHFNVLKQVINKFPDALSYKVFVGHKDRGGMTQEDSINIWNVYKNHLSNKVEVIGSPIAPITDVYKTAKENPDKDVIFVMGTRGEEDNKDILGRLSSFDKYDNLHLEIVQDSSSKDISGTEARKANPEKLVTFLPSELSEDDLEIVTTIIQGISEDTTRTTKKGAKGTFKAKITKAYGGPVTIEKAKKFKNRKGATAHDKAQANWFINMHSKNEVKDPKGIKAYSIELMEDDDNVLMLKDMDQSYVKYIKDNYGEPNMEHDFFSKDLTRYYKTTDINKETGGVTHKIIDLPSFRDSFTKLRRAYASLKQLRSTGKVSDDKKMMEIIEELRQLFNKYRTHLRRFYPVQYKGIKSSLNEMVQNNKQLLTEGVYDTITSQVSSDIFNAWKEFYDNNKEGDFTYDEEYDLLDKKGREMYFNVIAKIEIKETEEGIYRVDGGADQGDEDINGTLFVNFQVDPRDLPKQWSTISMDLRDVVRHEIEHLSQSGYNLVSAKEMQDSTALRAMIDLGLLPQKDYYKLEDEIPAMLQGMYQKAKKSKTPFKEVINDYFDKVQLSQEERKEILGVWKKYLPSLSLPRIDESKGEIKENTIDYNKIDYYFNYISNLLPEPINIIQEGDNIVISGFDNNYTPGYMENLTNQINSEMEAKEAEPLNESVNEAILDKFLDFCCEKLGISKDFSVSLHDNRDTIRTLAQYNMLDGSVDVYTKGRLTADILRSIAHELVHHKQNVNGEIDMDNLPQDIGGQIEDEANAVAGQLVKEFGYSNEEIFENIDPKAQKKHKGKSAPFGSAYEPVKEDGQEVSDKNMDDYKKSNLKEQTGKPKAIIFAGAPGAGKSSFIEKISNAEVLNLDDYFIKNLRDANVSLDLKNADAEGRSKAAKAMAAANQEYKGVIQQVIQGNKNFVLDGTAASYNVTKKMKDQLEELGYDVMMVYIFASLQKALDRNDTRFTRSKGEDRSLSPSLVMDTWNKVTQNYDEYKTLFGDNFVSVVNDKQLKKGEDRRSLEDLFLVYIEPYRPTDTKEKTPKQKEASKKRKEATRKQIEDFIKSNKVDDIIQNSMSKKEANQKIQRFITSNVLKEDESQEPWTVYLDMDGVLANFEEGFKKLTGKYPHDFGDDKRYMWNTYRYMLRKRNIPERDFWANLPKTENGDAMVNSIKTDNVYVLTSPPKYGNEAREGKTDFIKKHYPFVKDIIFKYSGTKHEAIANHNPEVIEKSVLIDDYSKNIIPWRKTGGVGLQYRDSNASATIQKIKDLNI